MLKLLHSTKFLLLFYCDVAVPLAASWPGHFVQKMFLLLVAVLAVRDGTFDRGSLWRVVVERNTRCWVNGTSTYISGAHIDCLGRLDSN